MKESFADIVRRELKERQTTAIKEARRAGLGRDSIRSVLRGRLPSVDRAAEICDALGLEFYIGPARGTGPAPPLDGTHTHDVSSAAPGITDVRALQSDLNDAVEKLSATTAALEALAPGLADETALTVAGNDNAAPPAGRLVAVHDLGAAAGGGTLDIDDAPVKGQMWFSRPWLDKHGIDPTRCAVIGVRGDSMHPTLVDGCSILVDRNRTRRRAGRIYVIRTGDGLITKRLGRDGGAWTLVSDNEAEPVRAWSDDMEIIGEVRWTARTLAGA